MPATPKCCLLAILVIDLLAWPSATAAAEPAAPSPEGSQAYGRLRPYTVEPPSNRTRSVKPKISYGNYAKRGQFPFMAALYEYTDSDGSYYGPYCGASLIHPRILLTAAHCLYYEDGSLPDPTAGYGTYAAVGILDFDNDDSSKYDEIAITKWVPHEGYDPLGDTLANDLALMLLKEESTKKVLEMAPEDQEYKARMPVTTAGWGGTEDASYSSWLKWIKLRIWNRRRCNWLGIPVGALCVGNPTGYGDGCPGDSGSPYWIWRDGKKLQVGISSYGYNIKCGAYVTEGVVTDVAYHRPWIEKTMAKLLE